MDTYFKRQLIFLWLNCFVAAGSLTLIHLGQFRVQEKWVQQIRCRWIQLGILCIFQNLHKTPHVIFAWIDLEPLLFPLIAWDDITNEVILATHQKQSTQWLLLNDISQQTKLILHLLLIPNNTRGASYFGDLLFWRPLLLRPLFWRPLILRASFFVDLYHNSLILTHDLE